VKLSGLQNEKKRQRGDSLPFRPNGPFVPIAKAVGLKQILAIQFDELLPKWNYTAVPQSN